MGTLLFATFMAPNMTSVYAGVTEEVGKAVGVATELVVGDTVEQVRDGPIDVAFLCGLPYVRLQRQRPGSLALLAAPVVDEPRFLDRPLYFSDVIVRRDSPYRSFAELRGKHWAHNCVDSFSGCLVTRYQLALMGESEAFFGRLSYSGSHQASIQRVLAGEIDASAIDAHVLALERRRTPDIDERLRVIATLGPAPIPPVVASTRLSEALRARLARAFCRLVRDARAKAILEQGMIRRYVPVNDQDYDDIRRKLAVVERSIARHDQLAGLGA